MRRIRCHDDISEGLAVLVASDARLEAVAARAGDVPLRLSAPGLASLVSIIVSQQVSRHSADAIMQRLVSHIVPLDAQSLRDTDDRTFRAIGLSRPKQKTLLALALAIVEEGLDLTRLADLGEADAMSRLTALHGIGPWTAEVYLLFCAGHPDVFPAHDVALQSAVGHALGIDPRPGAKELYRIAESWAPWRGVAARLFWAYYREMKGGEAAILAANEKIE